MDNENTVPTVIEMELPPQSTRTTDMIAKEIKTFSAIMANSAIEIGRRFVEAKQMLPHGQFGAWVTKKTGFAVSTANNYMRLFLEYGAAQGSLFGAEAESNTIGTLATSKALALLALPPTEREAFAEEVDAEGLSVRELRREIEEYQRKQEATQSALDAERNRSAELQRQLDNASTQSDIRWAQIREEERLKAESSQEILLTAAKDSAEQARKDVEKLRAALKEAKAERDKYKSGIDEAKQEAKEKAVAEMQAKLNKAEERAKQIQLTHELNTKDLVEHAKQEANAELREKLSRTEAALDEANKSAKAASEAENQLRQELSKMRNQTADGGTGKAVAQFELLFQQAVTTANQMRDIMLAARQTDVATSDRLSGVLVKLADEIRRCAT